MEIWVRSRVLGNGGWYTEWHEKTFSWKKAWQIVDNCGADRDLTHKWVPGDDLTFLDIDGLVEQRQRAHRWVSESKAAGFTDVEIVNIYGEKIVALAKEGT